MYFSVGFVLAALTLSATAIPTPLPSTRISLKKTNKATNDDGTANLAFLRGHRTNLITKIGKGLDAYERNTGNRHPSAHANRISLDLGLTLRGESGADPLSEQSDGSLWSGTISVGTPPVEYTVDYDTGSSDLFLPGPKCTENCDGHKIYAPGNSTTSKDLGKTFKLGYGDGSSVSGDQYTDTVKIAKLTATGQTLGVASVYSNGFKVDSFSPDGLMGMAFESLSSYGANPVFQSLVDQKRTAEPVFAFKLTDVGSELFVGGVNKKLYTGDFTYAPVTQKAYWQVKMDTVSVDGKKALENHSAIIDSGTTLILGDTASVKELFNQIPGSKDASQTVGAGYWTVPCDKVPTVSLSFGGKAWNISPKRFNIGQVKAGSPDCVAGITGGDIGADFWVVGDVFMSGVYTAFDVGAGRVGFAALADDGTPAN